MKIKNRNLDRLCVISGEKLISETFIREHETRLGPKTVLLHGAYPRYIYAGRSLRSMYTRKSLTQRLSRLAPAVVYDKCLRVDEFSLCRSAFEKFLLRNNVGCILAEYGMTGADVASHARRCGIPLLVHFHGHDAYHKGYLQVYESRLREMFEYAACNFVVSEHMQRQVKLLGAPAESIVLNPYGPREHFFELNRDPRGFLLALGRFVETKAPYLTLLAFERVLRKKPDARLEFVGDGPLLPVCRDMARSMGIDGAVHFAGSVPPDKSSNYFGRASMFLQHSVTTAEGVMEGTPVAILEASAAGLPIVSTRHAGIPQAVLDGVTGFLVDERDVDGMSSRILRLMEDARMAEQFGRRGREHMRENFRQVRHIQCIQDKIDQFLGSEVR